MASYSVRQTVGATGIDAKQQDVNNLLDRRNRVYQTFGRRVVLIGYGFLCPDRHNASAGKHTKIEEHAGKHRENDRQNYDNRNNASFFRLAERRLWAEAWMMFFSLILIWVRPLSTSGRRSSLHRNCPPVDSASNVKGDKIFPLKPMYYTIETTTDFGQS